MTEALPCACGVVISTLFGKEGSLEMEGGLRRERLVGEEGAMGRRHGEMRSVTVAQQ